MAHTVSGFKNTSMFCSALYERHREQNQYIFVAKIVLNKRHALKPTN